MMLRCGDEKIHVHRVILSASSYFHRLFSSKVNEEEEGVIEFGKEAFRDIKAVTEFLYTDNYPQTLSKEDFDAVLDYYGIQKDSIACITKQLDIVLPQ